MTLLSRAIVLLLGLAPFIVEAQPRGPVFLLGEGRDNVMQNWEVSRQQWSAQPKWTPTSGGPPPLPISRAIELGEAWLRKRHSDINKIAVGSITIRPQAGSSLGIEEGWFYRIEFQPVVAGKKLWGGELVAVVLFDGTVVEPRAEPYASGQK
jgi:hypothetical protein